MIHGIVGLIITECLNVIDEKGPLRATKHDKHARNKLVNSFKMRAIM